MSDLSVALPQQTAIGILPGILYLGLEERACEAGGNEVREDQPSNAGAHPW